MSVSRANSAASDTRLKSADQNLARPVAGEDVDIHSSHGMAGSSQLSRPRVDFACAQCYEEFSPAKFFPHARQEDPVSLQKKWRRRFR